MPNVDFDKTLALIGRVVDRMAAMESHPHDYGTGVVLHRAEIHTVQAVGDEPGLSVGDLAERMGVTKGAASQMVRRLEDKRMLTRSHPKGNRKTVALKLTELGEAARSEHMRYHQSMERLVREHLGERFAEMTQAFDAVFSELEAVLDRIDGGELRAWAPRRAMEEDTDG